MGLEHIKAEVFSDFLLSDKTVEWLRVIFAELRDFEKEDKTKKPTTVQKVAHLRKIEAASRQIYDRLQDLNFGCSLTLDHELQALGCNRVGVDPNTQNSELFTHISYMEKTLLNLEEAAKKTADYVGKTQNTRGRKSVIGFYASSVARVAVALKSEDIKAGRNGKFERICEAGFLAAGVPSKPEGAIKHFMKEMHPRYQKEGYCL